MPQISKHCTVMPTLNESERQQLLSVEPSILAILGTAEQDTVGLPRAEQPAGIPGGKHFVSHTPHPGISLHAQKAVPENTWLPSPRELGKGGGEQLGLSTTRDDEEGTSGMIHCTHEKSPQRSGQQRHARKQHTPPSQLS